MGRFLTGCDFVKLGIWEREVVNMYMRVQTLRDRGSYPAGDFL